MSVKALALSLPAQAFQTISWREGTNQTLSGRFAALRVRRAGGHAGKARLRPLQWLLIEWPANEVEPSNYILFMLPEDTPLNELVSAAHQRWRIERDYQDLKQDLGWGTARGAAGAAFTTMPVSAMAAYGFLMAERLIAGKPVGGKKLHRTPSAALPEDYIPHGSPARAAARGAFDHDATTQPELSTDRSSRTVPSLRQGKRKTSLVTQ